MHPRDRSIIALTAFAATLILAIPAAADVLDGDFESGGVGWSMSFPAAWSGSFPATGGHPGGHAFFRSPITDSAGRGCIRQTFACGDPGSGTACDISLEFLLRLVDAAPGSGRLLLTLDGATTVLAAGDTDWTRYTTTVPCGVHTIELCLEVDAGNHWWEAGFDNVEATCLEIVPAGGRSWGALKGTYR